MSRSAERRPLASLDRDRLGELRADPMPHRSFTRITGRLVQFAIQPLRIGVQTADQTLWQCDYPPELEDVLYELTRQLVTVTGLGEQTGRRTGRFKMVSIEPASAASPEQLPVWNDELPPRVLLSSPSALELAAMQGARPLVDVDDARVDIWEDDAGVDDFVNWVQKRRAGEESE